MKINLGTCSIQRPLDTLDQVRLRLEAEAVLGILEQIETGRIDLVSSTVLELETSRNPHPLRREHGEQTLRHASETIVVDTRVEERARELFQQGIAAMDALHLASAEQAAADYFCTCDDVLLRKARQIARLEIQVVSPVELI